MQPFHFRCLNGDLVTVKSADEQQARAQAMELRWGAPVGIYAPTYAGRGLMLVGADGLPIREMA